MGSDESHFIVSSIVRDGHKTPQPLIKEGGREEGGRRGTGTANGSLNMSSKGRGLIGGNTDLNKIMIIKAQWAEIKTGRRTQ